MTNKLFVFSFLVLLTSCGLPYVHKVQLTKDDLSWIDQNSSMRKLDCTIMVQGI